MKDLIKKAHKEAWTREKLVTEVGVTRITKLVPLENGEYGLELTPEEVAQLGLTEDSILTYELIDDKMVVTKVE